MAHYLASGKKGDTLLFSLDTIHHIKDVMRLKIGKEFEAVYENRIYAVRLSSLEPFMVEIINELDEDRELNGSLSLAFALLKGRHDELILQKGTELGVSSFIPYVSDRTIIRFSKEKDKESKKERYLKILENAAEQCRRNKVPSLSKIINLKDLSKLENKTKLFAYEAVAIEGKPLKEELTSDTLLVIGPEGGFSEAEAKYLMDNGFKPVSLGRRILRAETAAIAASAIYSSKFEQ